MTHRIRTAAIILKDDKILLVKHVHSGRGEWWVPPGGGLDEVDADIFASAARETREETNLSVSEFRLIYISEYLDPFHDNTLNLELFFLANKITGELSIEQVPEEDCIAEARWFGENELTDILVFPEVLRSELWQDYAAGFPQIKYLGRQIGKV